MKSRTTTSDVTTVPEQSQLEVTWRRDGIVFCILRFKYWNARTPALKIPMRGDKIEIGILGEQPARLHSRRHP